MSNLVDYAKEELKKIGMIDSGEPYNDEVAKAILDLIELFSSQGHTGFTAPYTVDVFKRLAMFKPLTPLTGEDDEWNEVETGVYQNKRYSSVFKEDGKAYDNEGRIFTDDGEVWYGSKDSRVEITFPYTVPDSPEKVYLNKEKRETITSNERSNGDMIMNMFPDAIKSDYMESDMIMKDFLTIYIGDCEMKVSYDWWNAPYKEEIG